MDPQIAVERIAALSFIVVGLSHAARPQAWARWFAELHARGDAGAIDYGMIMLTFGALLVGFHGDVWRGLPMLVTIIGWAQVLKGAAHMIFPAFSLRSMQQVTPDRAWKFVVAGAIMAPAGGVMWWGSMR